MSHAHDFSELRNHHLKEMSTMINQFTNLNSLHILFQYCLAINYKVRNNSTFI